MSTFNNAVADWTNLNVEAIEEEKRLIRWWIIYYNMESNNGIKGSSDPTGKS